MPSTTISPVWHAARAHVYQQATENFGIRVSQFHILRRIRGGIDSVSRLACRLPHPQPRRPA